MDRKEIELARDRVIVAMEHAKAHGIAKFPTVNTDDLNTLLAALSDVEGLNKKVRTAFFEAYRKDGTVNDLIESVETTIRSHFGEGQ